MTRGLARLESNSEWTTGSSLVLIYASSKKRPFGVSGFEVIGGEVTSGEPKDKEKKRNVLVGGKEVKPRRMVGVDV